MSGVLQSLELRLRQAVDDDLSHSEFLLRLLTDEVDRRGAKQLDSRLRRASFEHHKSLEDFDFSFNAKIPKHKIIDLATCGFIGKHENVCLVGQTGVGKSHIAQAIGHRACAAGYQVLYTSAHQMLIGLRAARADDSHERKLARLVDVDLLIIDDLGLRGLTGRRAARPLRHHPATLRASVDDHHLEPRGRRVGAALQRQAAGRRRDGSAAPPRPRHRDHWSLVPQPPRPPAKKAA
jgi:hypothetical protein